MTALAGALIVPRFYLDVSPDDGASAAAGRPIFIERELCEIRFAADKQKVLAFPAHEFEPNATREAIASGAVLPGQGVTYAQLFSEQYRAFKLGQAQGVDGTPLSALTFLTEAKRRELKALNIHTAEALAALDGTPLRQLGMGGRELKNQAAAYLAQMAGAVDVSALAAQVARLQAQIKERDEVISGFATKAQKTKYQKAVERAVEAEAEAEADKEAAAAAPAENDPSVDGKPIEDCTDAELKAYIRRETGEPVRGNPGRETLIAKVTEIATAPPAPDSED